MEDDWWDKESSVDAEMSEDIREFLYEIKES